MSIARVNKRSGSRDGLRTWWPAVEGRDGRQVHLCTRRLALLEGGGERWREEFVLGRAPHRAGRDEFGG